MPRYTPSSLPNDTPKGLKAWLAEELRRISAAIDGASFVQLQVMGVEPQKRRDGMIVYADGIAWDPGSGAGFYGYESGAWVKL